MTKSALQIARAAYQPKLPKALKGTVKAAEGAATQSVADQEEIKLEEIVISTPKKDKEEPVIRRGPIEFFNESKGFGFIKDLSGVEKYFFHINNVLTDIAENNIVTFDLERGLKGMNAVNVALEVEKAKEKKENKETLNTES